MAHIAATECLAISIMILCAEGAWDGLVRRHIRMNVEAIGLYINIRSFFALLIGLSSLIVEGYTSYFTVRWFRMVNVSCSNKIFLPCALHLTLFPLVEYWICLLVIAMATFLFVLWIRGATDLHGPYFERLLALGVWYKEKEVIVLAQSRLAKDHSSPVPEDTIARMAFFALLHMRTYLSVMGERLFVNGHLDPSLLTDAYLIGNKNPLPGVPPKAKRIIIQTIFEYYLVQHERAVQVWPWRRKLLGY